jgi:DNA-binding MarR family transcriptional regulator
VLNKPGLFARELAVELQISRSTVTRFLDSLEKRDYIVRKEETRDCREIRIYPLKKAKKIHRELDKTGKALSKEISEIFGKSELTEIVRKIRVIEKGLKSQL